MAVWIAPNQRYVGSIGSPKTTLNLMQNCDLPPPMKLFSGPDDTFLSLISKSYNMRGGQETAAKENDVLHSCRDRSESYDKLELLKALRLSQTRAREAERKLAVLNKEKDELSNLVVKESMGLFAHRHWVRLLEFEVIKLHRQKKRESEEKWCGDEGKAAKAGM
ncbi:hypothetical protein BUALT_Bualt04G0027300 [Buddleja alternifolia]|uniref:Uncharacterized protein n=1 Tax=Buddleja alternifolia TaxID=168488 RepID=A0AAV6XQ44_9LAMI|nr:hypothetical protein BUALT_Bualt04G0027300 [Buddleja alternifolia]